MQKKKKSKAKQMTKKNKKDREATTKAFSRFIGKLAGIPVYSSDNLHCEEHTLKKYSDSDLIEAAKEERQKTFTILNYILNKNSRPLSEGGVNYERAFDEVQDFENYLLKDL